MSGHEDGASEFGELGFDAGTLLGAGKLFLAGEGHRSLVLAIVGEGECKAKGYLVEAHRYRDAALGRGAREESLKLLVVVAEERRAGSECAGHLFKVEACAFDLVYTEALQESALIDVAESVAIVQGLGRRYRDVAASYLLDASDGFTHRLGGGKGGDNILKDQPEKRKISSSLLI